MNSIYPLTFSEVVNALRNFGPELCIRALPKSPYHALYGAMICGLPLPAGEAKQLIVDSGMIHLMIVSGWHLLVLERALVYLPRPARLSLLLVYVALTGFGAPAVRAFLRRLLRPILRRHLALTALQSEAVGSGLALLFYPPWIFSRSFLMSWMGGLAVTSPALINKHPHWDRSIKAYFLLLPFTFASPFTVAANVLLAPFVGLILFPGAALTLLCPPLLWLGDGMWFVFLKLLHSLPSAESGVIFLSSHQLFWLPPTLHVSFLIAEVKWRRAVAFSYLS